MMLENCSGSRRRPAAVTGYWKAGRGGGGGGGGLRWESGSGGRRRPAAVTGYWKAVPDGDGGWPSAPAGFWRFWAWIARLTSVAVKPSFAILSGLIQTRMP